MTNIRDIVREVAFAASNKGAGYSQTGPVLDEIRQRLGSGAQKPDLQQEVLTAFHDLFRDGELTWGYNFDNPGPPFFHRSIRK